MYSQFFCNWTRSSSSHSGVRKLATVARTRARAHAHASVCRGRGGGREGLCNCSRRRGRRGGAIAVRQHRRQTETETESRACYAAGRSGIQDKGTSLCDPARAGSPWGLSNQVGQFEPALIDHSLLWKDGSVVVVPFFTCGYAGLHMAIVFIRQRVSECSKGPKSHPHMPSMTTCDQCDHI